MKDPPSGASPQPASVTTLPFTTGLNGVNLGLDKLTSHLLWYSILAICGIVCLGRFVQMGNAHLRHLFNLSASPVQQKYWSTDKTRFWPRFKKYRLYSPLFRTRHNKEIQLSSAISVGTLPSRLHTLLLVLYLASNVAYCCLLDYKRANKASLLAELRGRTGHLAVINMVPLVVLAGRNNPLIPLLRVSFDTYNLFHRWIGRIVVLESILHTMAWAVNMHTARGWAGVQKRIAEDAFTQYGLVATVAMVIILFQAPSMVRHAFCETFLHLHQFLALAAFLGVFVHVQKGNLPQRKMFQGPVK